MGILAKNENDGEGRDISESSGLADIMEIAAALGIEDKPLESEGITRADEDDDDDLHNIAAGYGGTAAAALVADATVEPPAAEPVKAANAPKSDPKIPAAKPAEPPKAAPKPTLSVAPAPLVSPAASSPRCGRSPSSSSASYRG